MDLPMGKFSKMLAQLGPLMVNVRDEVFYEKEGLIISH